MRTTRTIPSADASRTLLLVTITASPSYESTALGRRPACGRCRQGRPAASERCCPWVEGEARSLREVLLEDLVERVGAGLEGVLLGETLPTLHEHRRIIAEHVGHGLRVPEPVPLGAPLNPCVVDGGVRTVDAEERVLGLEHHGQADLQALHDAHRERLARRDRVARESEARGLTQLPQQLLAGELAEEPNPVGGVATRDGLRTAKRLAEASRSFSLAALPTLEGLQPPGDVPDDVQRGVRHPLP